METIDLTDPLEQLCKQYGWSPKTAAENLELIKQGVNVDLPDKVTIEPSDTIELISDEEEVSQSEVNVSITVSDNDDDSKESNGVTEVQIIQCYENSTTNSEEEEDDDYFDEVQATSAVDITPLQVSESSNSSEGTAQGTDHENVPKKTDINSSTSTEKSAGKKSQKDVESDKLVDAIANEILEYEDQLNAAADKISKRIKNQESQKLSVTSEVKDNSSPAGTLENNILRDKENISVSEKPNKSAGNSETDNLSENLSLGDISDSDNNELIQNIIDNLGDEDAMSTENFVIDDPAEHQSSSDKEEEKEKGLSNNPTDTKDDKLQKEQSSLQNRSNLKKKECEPSSEDDLTKKHFKILKNTTKAMEVADSKNDDIVAELEAILALGNEASSKPNYKSLVHPAGVVGLSLPTESTDTSNSPEKSINFNLSNNLKPQQTKEYNIEESSVKNVITGKFNEEEITLNDQQFRDIMNAVDDKLVAQLADIAGKFFSDKTGPTKKKIDEKNEVVETNVCTIILIGDKKSNKPVKEMKNKSMEKTDTIEIENHENNVAKLTKSHTAILVEVERNKKVNTDGNQEKGITIDLKNNIELAEEKSNSYVNEKDKQNIIETENVKLTNDNIESVKNNINEYARETELIKDEGENQNQKNKPTTKKSEIEKESKNDAHLEIEEEDNNFEFRTNDFVESQSHKTQNEEEEKHLDKTPEENMNKIKNNSQDDICTDLVTHIESIENRDKDLRENVLDTDNEIINNSKENIGAIKTDFQKDLIAELAKANNIELIEDGSEDHEEKKTEEENIQKDSQEDVIAELANVTNIELIEEEECEDLVNHDNKEDKADSAHGLEIRDSATHFHKVEIAELADQVQVRFVESPVFFDLSTDTSGSYATSDEELEEINYEDTNYAENIGKDTEEQTILFESDNINKDVDSVIETSATKQMHLSEPLKGTKELQELDSKAVPILEPKLLSFTDSLLKRFAESKVTENFEKETDHTVEEFDNPVVLITEPNKATTGHYTNKSPEHVKPKIVSEDNDLKNFKNSATAGPKVLDKVSEEHNKSSVSVVGSSETKQLELTKPIEVDNSVVSILKPKLLPSTDSLFKNFTDSREKMTDHFNIESIKNVKTAIFSDTDLKNKITEKSKVELETLKEHDKDDNTATNDLDKSKLEELIIIPTKSTESQNFEKETTEFCNNNSLDNTKIVSDNANNELIDLKNLGTAESKVLQEITKEPNEDDNCGFNLASSITKQLELTKPIEDREKLEVESIDVPILKPKSLLFTDLLLKRFTDSEESEPFKEQTINHCNHKPFVNLSSEIVSDNENNDLIDLKDKTNAEPKVVQETNKEHGKDSAFIIDSSATIQSELAEPVESTEKLEMDSKVESKHNANDDYTSIVASPVIEPSVLTEPVEGIEKLEEVDSSAVPMPSQKLLLVTDLISKRFAESTELESLEKEKTKTVSEDVSNDLMGLQNITPLKPKAGHETNEDDDYACMVASVATQPLKPSEPIEGKEKLEEVNSSIEPILKPNFNNLMLADVRSKNLESSEEETEIIPVAVTNDLMEEVDNIETISPQSDPVKETEDAEKFDTNLISQDDEQNQKKEVNKSESSSLVSIPVKNSAEVTVVSKIPESKPEYTSKLNKTSFATMIFKRLSGETVENASETYLNNDDIYLKKSENDQKLIVNSSEEDTDFLAGEQNSVEKLKKTDNIPDDLDRSNENIETPNDVQSLEETNKDEDNTIIDSSKDTEEKTNNTEQNKMDHGHDNKDISENKETDYSAKQSAKKDKIMEDITQEDESSKSKEIEAPVIPIYKSRKLSITDMMLRRFSNPEILEDTNKSQENISSNAEILKVVTDYESVPKKSLENNVLVPEPEDKRTHIVIDNTSKTHEVESENNGDDDFKLPQDQEEVRKNLLLQLSSLRTRKNTGLFGISAIPNTSYETFCVKRYRKKEKSVEKLQDKVDANEAQQNQLTEEIKSILSDEIRASSRASSVQSDLNHSADLESSNHSTFSSNLHSNENSLHSGVFEIVKNKPTVSGVKKTLKVKYTEEIAGPSWMDRPFRTVSSDMENQSPNFNFVIQSVSSVQEVENENEKSNSIDNELISEDASEPIDALIQNNEKDKPVPNIITELRKIISKNRNPKNKRPFQIETDSKSSDVEISGKKMKISISVKPLDQLKGAQTSNPFESNALEEFLTENSKLHVSYDVPKSGAEEGLKQNYNDDDMLILIKETKEDTNDEEKSKAEPKIKARTLAEKRRLYEKKQKIMAKQEAKAKKLEENAKKCYILFKNQQIYVKSHLTSKCLAKINSNSRSEVVEESSNDVEGPRKLAATMPRKQSLLREMFERNKPNFKYKAGPLSKKPQLQKSADVWVTELKELPKVTLEIHAEFGKPVPKDILHLLPQSDGEINEEQVEFAITALKLPEKHRKPYKYIFEVPYRNNQTQILVKKRQEILPSIETVEERDKKLNLEEVVTNIIEGLINYVELKELAPSLIKDDEDCNYVEDKDKNDFNKTVSLDEKHLLLKKGTSHKGRRKPTPWISNELRRLNCKLVEVEVAPSPEEEEIACEKPYCKLGCVCKSLLGESYIGLHCGKLKCMFGCDCPKINDKISKFSQIKMPAGTDLFSTDTVSRIEDEAKRHLAKVERDFTQTIIQTGDKTIVVGFGNKPRRATKTPKKYTDYFDEDIDVYLQKKRNNSIEELKKQMKSCCIEIEKFDFSNIMPYCLVHNLYNCYCKGLFKFVDPDDPEANFVTTEVEKPPKIPKKDPKKQNKEKDKDKEKPAKITHKKKLRSPSPEKSEESVSHEDNEPMYSSSGRPLRKKSQKSFDGSLYEVSKKKQKPEKPKSESDEETFDDISESARTKPLDRVYKRVNKMDNSMFERDFIKNITQADLLKINLEKERMTDSELLKITLIADERRRLHVEQANQKQHKRKQILQTRDMERIMIKKARMPNVKQVFEGEIIVDDEAWLEKFCQNKQQSMGYARILPWKALLKGFLSKTLTVNCLREYPFRLVLTVGTNKLPYALNVETHAETILNDNPRCLDQTKNVLDIVKWLTDCSLPEKYNEASLSFLLMELGKDQFEIRGLCTQNAPAAASSKKPSSGPAGSTFKPIDHTQSYGSLRVPTESTSVAPQPQSPNKPSVNKEVPSHIILGDEETYPKLSKTPTEPEQPLMEVAEGTSQVVFHKDLSGRVRKMYLTRENYPLQELIDGSGTNPKNINVTNELYMWVALPQVFKSGKWRMIPLTNDFEYLHFIDVNYTVKYVDLVRFTEIAKEGKCTIVLKTQCLSLSYAHTIFGIYVDQNYPNKIFLGPYFRQFIREDVETLFQGKNNAFLSTTKYQNLLGNKKYKCGHWLIQRSSLSPPKTEVQGMVDLTEDDDKTEPTETKSPVETINQTKKTTKQAKEDPQNKKIGQTEDREDQPPLDVTVRNPVCLLDLTGTEDNEIIYFKNQPIYIKDSKPKIPSDFNRFIITNIPRFGYLGAIQSPDKESLEVCWPFERKVLQFQNSAQAKEFLLARFINLLQPVPESFKIAVFITQSLDLSKFAPVDSKFLTGHCVCGVFGVYNFRFLNDPFCRQILKCSRTEITILFAKRAHEHIKRRIEEVAILSGLKGEEMVRLKTHGVLYAVAKFIRGQETKRLELMAELQKQENLAVENMKKLYNLMANLPVAERNRQCEIFQETLKIRPHRAISTEVVEIADDSDHENEPQTPAMNSRVGSIILPNTMPEDEENYDKQGDSNEASYTVVENDNIVTFVAPHGNITSQNEDSLTNLSAQTSEDSVPFVLTQNDDSMEFATNEDQDSFIFEASPASDNTTGQSNCQNENTTFLTPQITNVTSLADSEENCQMDSEKQLQLEKKDADKEEEKTALRKTTPVTQQIQKTLLKNPRTLLKENTSQRFISVQKINFPSNQGFSFQENEDGVLILTDDNKGQKPNRKRSLLMPKSQIKRKKLILQQPLQTKQTFFENDDGILTIPDDDDESTQKKSKESGIESDSNKNKITLPKTTVFDLKSNGAQITVQQIEEPDEPVQYAIQKFVKPAETNQQAVLLPQNSSLQTTTENLSTSHHAINTLASIKPILERPNLNKKIAKPKRKPKMVADPKVVVQLKPPNQMPRPVAPISSSVNRLMQQGITITKAPKSAKNKVQKVTDNMQLAGATRKVITVEKKLQKIVPGGFSIVPKVDKNSITNPKPQEYLKVIQTTDGSFVLVDGESLPTQTKPNQTTVTNLVIQDNQIVSEETFYTDNDVIINEKT